MPVCLIGLGSNQGDRRATLDAAVDAIGRIDSIAVLAKSTWRETSPVGGPVDQPRYLNGAIRIETSLGPRELLGCLRQIEEELGRRREQRWAARTIDLDLLLYDGLVMSSAELIVPHPRMAWRRFVLESAAEVAGDMIHPTTRWTVARLLEHLNTAPRYIAITGAIAAGKTRLAERLVEAIPARWIEERPDWQELEAFYADPASHAWQVEMDFLRHRTQSLSADRVLSETVPWAVSDFWFDQSAAFARVWLAGERQPAYVEQFEMARREVVRPRLIVLLDAPAEELLARVHRRGRRCERQLNEGQLERIRKAVLEQIDGPDVGPVLRATCMDPDAVLAETLAAVQGME